MSLQAVTQNSEQPDLADMKRNQYPFNIDPSDSEALETIRDAHCVQSLTVAARLAIMNYSNRIQESGVTRIRESYGDLESESHDRFCLFLSPQENKQLESIQKAHDFETKAQALRTAIRLELKQVQKSSK